MINDNFDMTEETTTFDSEIGQPAASNRICLLLEELADREFSDIQIFPDTDIYVKDERGFINRAEDFNENQPTELEILEAANIMSYGYPQRKYIETLQKERNKPRQERNHIVLRPFNIAYEPLERSGRYRINFSFTETPDPENFGLSMFIRRIPPRPWTFEEIGFSGPALKLVSEIEGGSIHNGMILITGPTNCGKSTTATSLIHLYTSTFKNLNITTLEDPIEFRFVSDKAVIRQMEIGKHVPTLAEGLHTVLRQDPDIIMIQECRDQETARQAMEAARTGHLVIMTIHAYSCADALVKLSDWIGDPEVVGRYTTFCLAQLLLKPDRFQAVESVGSVQRRILVQEVTRPQNNPALLDSLRKKESIENISRAIKNSVEEQSFTSSFRNLIAEGKITVKMALNHTQDKLTLMSQLTGS